MLIGGKRMRQRMRFSMPYSRAGRSWKEETPEAIRNGVSPGSGGCRKNKEAGLNFQLFIFGIKLQAGKTIQERI